MEFRETRLGVLVYWIVAVLTIFAPTALLIGTIFNPHLTDIIYDFIMVMWRAGASVLEGLLAMVVSIMGLFGVA